MENEMEAGVIRGLYGDAHGNGSENGNCFSTWVYIGTTIRLRMDLGFPKTPTMENQSEKKRNMENGMESTLYTYISIYVRMI